jgi:malate dehydrogenase (oxaloacetate-decarboxylating)
MKRWLADETNPDGVEGALDEAMAGADFLLGLSGPALVSRAQLGRMAADPIVFALSNPDPEIYPDDARGLVRVMATGRSDFPNQVNNVLCFPGLFRGALDAGATAITEEMKIVAARAIASVIPDDQLNEDYILPSVFNEDVAKLVADAVAKEAKRSGHVRGPGSARIYI